mmetsp:Transcript_45738/g.74611  ORF Transcript_45738/g.74611 Transcript_45738/m.74611 type:complete len:317 (+) Transcript_45738:572-1522(+)
METKAKSAPMKEILNRIIQFGEFKLEFFEDHVLQHAPVESWPVCDCIIAFDSKGYPLQKVIEYYELRKPLSINDLKYQQALHDRRAVYNILDQHKIPHPRALIVSRDGFQGIPTPNIYEEDDYIMIDEVRLDKPFVEKPANADDHNVWIYFPRSQGGGCRQLFRKTEDRSSQFLPDQNRIRSNGSFVYEEFVSTQDRQDVKVYAVGMDFIHAESRKAPVVDGIVQRTPNSKEVRHVTTLTEAEHMLARKIVEAFKQTVCGLDMLRTEGGTTYVCDVNGWSFVKGSDAYYNNCSRILREMMLSWFLDKLSKEPPSTT